MVDTTHIVFFSPTHTSAKIARAIGDGIGMGRRIETDLTLDESIMPIDIKNALTIIAVPVYAGRVAPIALQRIRRLRGEMHQPFWLPFMAIGIMKMHWWN